jgi:ribosomal-protein-alanine N-acetyltransferase
MRTGRETSLVGPRVMLRALDAADHEAWRTIRIGSRDWLEPWEPLPEPGSPDPVTDREAFRARCGAWERQRQFDTAYGFGLFLHDGTLIGEISLGSVLRGPFQSCFIGYWISADHAGRGYVPEGVVLIIRFGFAELGLHRMEAAIVPRNEKSRRVVEKLGLRDEGTASRFLQIQGVWEDHVRYAITREEWEARREEFDRDFLA